MAKILHIPPSPSSSSSPQTHNKKPTKPKCTLQFLTFPVLATLLFLTLPLTTGISYSDRCNHIVRESPPANHSAQILGPEFLSLRGAHVDYHPNTTDNDKGNTVSLIPKSLSLSSRKAYKTQKDAVLRIEAVLTLNGVRYNPPPRRGLRLVHFRPPRIPVTEGDTWRVNSFSLTGYWDSNSGKLCMVGSGFGKLSSSYVVLKLDYLNSSSIFTSLVNGTLESFDVSGDDRVSSMSVLGVNLRDYKYELIDKEIESDNGFLMSDDARNVSLGVKELGKNVCRYVRSAGTVEMEYTGDCSRVNCNLLGGEGNFTPSVMYFNEIECLEDGRVRFLLGFGDFGYNGYQLPFEPNVTLVSEGKWDGETRKLNMVGCRIFSDWDEGFVGECLIRISLRFPAKWTLRGRSAVVGELWSSRRANESGYFSRVNLASIINKNIRAVALRYEYTEIENSKKSCANKTTKHRVKDGKYPRALSSDMRFDMVAGNRKVKDLWGYSSPLYVDKWRYQLSSGFGREDSSALLGKQNLTNNVINVSYVLNLATSHDFELSSEFKQIKSFEISAEGTYDPESGHLCMIGCMFVGTPKVRMQRNSSLDCEILVDIWYPQVHQSDAGVVKGTIESRRAKSDPLYFEPFEVFSRSIYAGQAKESIWRMDLEITMVLISNTLSCVFMGLQLLHVKRHAEVLPFISIIMLTVLTLAHLIPLLLNFEALFMSNHNNVNFYFGTDGWLEVNEVLVRVITMLAFLLEFRLLQLAWSARSPEENHNKLWTSDKKALCLSLPIYVGGGLVAWFVHLSRKSHQPLMRLRHIGYKQQSMWGDLKSYAGLILDGFLFPQIIFNLFSDAKEKALAPSFYIGTTFIRLMPHAYDLYRSRSSTWSFNYIYANPRMDYYSTTWDIIISLGGIAFIVLIYLQQTYGGRCLVSKKFWERSKYERVPVASAAQI